MDVSSPNPAPMDDSAEESRWIALAREGRDEGWRELHRRHYAGLWSAVNQVVHDDALAEDIVQEAFLKAFRKIRRFRGDSKFSTWIYRIAINQAYDAMRKQQRRSRWLGLFPLKAATDDDDSPEHEAVDTTRDASEAAALGDVRDALAQALDRLNPEHRAVVELRLIQGFSTEETARILKCKRGTVLSRLFYSCQKLKKHLESTHRDEQHQ